VSRVRRGASRAAILLVAVELAACGGPSASDEALERFLALVQRPDLTYRMSVVSQEAAESDGNTTTEYVVAGDDWSTVTKSDNFTFEMRRVGGRAWTRTQFEGNQWRETPAEAPGGPTDPRTLLRIIAGGQLSAVGPAQVGDADAHRITVRQPIEMSIPDSPAEYRVTGLDLLVDDEGRPIRAVLQVETLFTGDIGGPSPSPVTIVAELLFSDVGAPLTVEVPVVP